MEPGPITVLDPAAFDLGPAPAAPAAPATAEEAEFDRLAAELERDVGELTGGLGQDWRTELEQLHAEAEEGIYHDPLAVDSNELAEAAAAAAEADDQILEAYAEVPPETWKELPGPFEPPAAEGGFVVEPEPGPSTPFIPAPPPVYGPPLPSTPTAALHNVSGGGDLLYHVGEQWALALTGPPNSLVTCQGSQDGIPFGPAGFGGTDSLGRFGLAGNMSEYEVGHWVQEWRIGGQLCVPVLVFDVL